MGLFVLSQSALGNDDAIAGPVSLQFSATITDTVGIAESNQTLATETWTATNGAAWPAQWTTSISAGGSGTIDVQSNQGRMQVTTGSFTDAFAVLAGTAADLDLTIKAQVTATGGGGSIVVQVAFRRQSESDKYALNEDETGTLSFVRYVGGVATTLASTTNPITFTTAHWMRIRAVGSSLQAKVWLVGNSEPVGWTLSTTDTTFTSGAVRLQFEGGSAALTKSAVWDDLTLTTVGGVAVSVTSGSQSFTATVTDPVGIQNSLTGAVVGPYEPIGISDAIVVASGQTVSDAVGILDGESTALGRTQPADGVGISDSIATSVGVSQVATDNVGLLDAASYVYTPGGTSFAQTVTDSIGLLDSPVQVSTATQSFTDAIGIPDSASQSSVTSRSQTDAIGLLDSAAITGSATRPQSDSIGETDIADQVSVFLRSVRRQVVGT